MRQLTESQKKDLMHRYYEGENTQLLIDEFQLEMHANNLTKLFTDIELDEIRCPYCDIPLMLSPYPRSRGKDITKAFCNICDHKNLARCECPKCKGLRMKQNEKKRSDLKQLLVDYRRPSRQEEIKTESLSLRSAINLVGLCRAGLREDSTHIEPLTRLYDIFAYNFEDIESIHTDLYDKELIDISVSSTLDLLSRQTENFELDRHLIVWQLSIGTDPENNIKKLGSIENVLKNKEIWPEHWHSEVMSIWFELALEEILLYLKQRLQDHYLSPQIGDKTRRVFIDILHDFSISQIYNFIWGAVTNAVAYQVKKRLSSRHTVNIVPGNCQRRAEKAICEKWIIKDYRRDVTVPISTRVSIFSNVVTNLSDKFFTAVPNKALLA
jgi:hypothetical protein